MIENGVELFTLRGGLFLVNCYLVSVGPEIAVIDPGVELEQILWEIRNRRKTPVWSAATHGHIDHIDVAKEVSERLKVPFYMHPEDYLLIEGRAPSQLYQNIHGFVLDDIFELDESERPKYVNILNQKSLRVGGVELEVIETPGHTFGSVSFYMAQANALFCGDWTSNHGDYVSAEQFTHSVEVLFGLPEETTVYPGHGEPMTMSGFREKARTNRWMKSLAL